MLWIWCWTIARGHVHPGRTPCSSEVFCHKKRTETDTNACKRLLMKTSQTFQKHYAKSLLKSSSSRAINKQDIRDKRKNTGKPETGIRSKPEHNTALKKLGNVRYKHKLSKYFTPDTRHTHNGLNTHTNQDVNWNQVRLIRTPLTVQGCRQDINQTKHTWQCKQNKNEITEQLRNESSFLTKFVCSDHMTACYIHNLSLSACCWWMVSITWFRFGCGTFNIFIKSSSDLLNASTPPFKRLGSFGNFLVFQLSTVIN